MNAPDFIARALAVRALADGAQAGADGASAYEVAVANGFEGSETEWLVSLIGPQGEPGPQGPTGSGLVDGDKGDITVSGGGATWTIDDNAVTDAKLRNSAALSVIGRSSNTSGDPADISADTDGHVLRRSGTTLGFGTVTTAGIADAAVSYAKMQNVSAASRIIGRKTAGAGDPEECTLSEVLDFIGSAAQGDILYRGASSWARLGAGTSGQFLKTQGTGANPAWDFPGWSQIASSTGVSGVNEVQFTSIPSWASALLIVGRGISVSATNGVYTKVRASTTWSGAASIGVITSGSSREAHAYFPACKLDWGVRIGAATDSGPGSSPGHVDMGNAQIAAWRATGGITGVAIYINASNFTAGDFYLYGRP